jgi:hypothetical protein
MLNSEYIKAVKLQTKVCKLANLKNKSFKFRLNAVLAADSRKGKFW